MIKKSFVMSLLLASSLNAGMFGDLAGSFIGGDSKSDSTSTEMGTILDTMDQSNKTLMSSVETINSLLGDKKQLAKWKEQTKSIEKLVDEEKVQATVKLNQEKMVYTIALGENKDVIAKTKKLSNDQKTKIGLAVSDILLASMKEKEASEKAKVLVKSIIASPKSMLQYAGDLPKLKGVVDNTPTMLKEQDALCKSMEGLAKNANIAIKQPKAAEENS